MQLLPIQVQELINIIDANQAIMIGEELGADFLTDQDKALLEKNGIDYKSKYSPQGNENSSINISFHFGMLAQAIGVIGANELDFPTLKQYVKDGQYIPVSSEHLATLSSIKMQSFSSLKTMNGKIFADVNNIVLQSKLNQEGFLVKETKDGIDKRQTVRQIANAISEKTGDWNRDFDRIIETACQTAFEQGKAAEIQRRNPGKDPLVYKKVFESACKHCIRLYLSNGTGSQPKIFKLSELKSNGSNIGRKVENWLPTIDATHPYCRCAMYEVPEGFIWNKETQSFSTPDPEWKLTIIHREKIRVVIGGKEVWL